MATLAELPTSPWKSEGLRCFLFWGEGKSCPVCPPLCSHSPLAHNPLPHTHAPHTTAFHTQTIPLPFFSFPTYLLKPGWKAVYVCVCVANKERPQFKKILTESPFAAQSLLGRGSKRVTAKKGFPHPLASALHEMLLMSVISSPDCPQHLQRKVFTLKIQP